jgi:hypothetical protein
MSYIYGWSKRPHAEAPIVQVCLKPFKAGTERHLRLPTLLLHKALTATLSRSQFRLVQKAHLGQCPTSCLPPRRPSFDYHASCAIKFTTTTSNAMTLFCTASNRTSLLKLMANLFPSRSPSPADRSSLRWKDSRFALIQSYSQPVAPNVPRKMRRATIP